MTATKDALSKGLKRQTARDRVERQSTRQCSDLDSQAVRRDGRMPRGLRRSSMEKKVRQDLDASATVMPGRASWVQGDSEEGTRTSKGLRRFSDRLVPNQRRRSSMDSSTTVGSSILRGLDKNQPSHTQQPAQQAMDSSSQCTQEATEVHKSKGLQRFSDHWANKQRCSSLGHPDSAASIDSSSTRGLGKNQHQRHSQDISHIQEELTGSETESRSLELADGTHDEPEINVLPALSFGEGLVDEHDIQVMAAASYQEFAVDEPDIQVMSAAAGLLQDVLASDDLVAGPAVTSGVVPPPRPNTVELDETNSRAGETNTSHVDLVEATPVLDEPDSLDLMEAQQVDPAILEKKSVKEQKERECRRIGYVFIVVACLIVAVSLGVRLGTGKIAIDRPVALEGTPGEVPLSDSLPVENLLELFGSLPDNTRKRLSDSGSPQRKAWNWLLNHQHIAHLPEWRKAQIFALVTFFFAFEGPSWPEKTRKLWLNDTIHECSWIVNDFESINSWSGGFLEGTSLTTETCSEFGQYHSIFLHHLRLGKVQPIIPPEIALLTSLQVMAVPFSGIQKPLSEMLPSTLFEMKQLGSLNFFANRLSGTVPRTLGSMTSLTSLQLSSNTLSGSIPSELCLLTGLNNLQMSQNDLTATLPTEIGRLSNITELQLWDNLLTGSLPTELGLLTDLELLGLGTSNLAGLRGNRFTGPIPSQMQSLTSLYYLNLHSNSLTGSIPTEFGFMTKLNHLDLVSNALTGTLPTELGLLKSMWNLHLSTNTISGKIPRELIAMTALDCLGLDGNNLQGAIPTEVGGISTLRFLHLSENYLTSTIPSELGLLTHLRQMYLQDNKLSGSLPSELGEATLLREIDLANNRNYGGFPAELVRLPELHYLNMGGMNGLSGTISAELCHLKDPSCSKHFLDGTSAKCTFQFECTSELCGCDCRC